MKSQRGGMPKNKCFFSITFILYLQTIFCGKSNFTKRAITEWNFSLLFQYITHQVFCFASVFDKIWFRRWDLKENTWRINLCVRVFVNWYHYWMLDVLKNCNYTLTDHKSITVGILNFSFKILPFMPQWYFTLTRKIIFYKILDISISSSTI